MVNTLAHYIIRVTMIVLLYERIIFNSQYSVLLLSIIIMSFHTLLKDDFAIRLEGKLSQCLSNIRKYWSLAQPVG